MDDEFNYKVVNTIDDVPREEWDAMVVANPYMCWGWLKTVEQTRRVEHDVFYILAYHDNQLYGGTVCSSENRSSKIHNIDNVIFGRLKQYTNLLNISLAPLLICSPIKGRGTCLLARTDLGEEIEDQLINGLLVQVERLATSKKMAVSFSGLNEKEAGFRKKLVSRGYLETLGYPISLLDIKWNSFDDYQQDADTLSKKLRKNIRLQVNRNRKAGVVITDVNRPQQYGDRLDQLVNLNTHKHNKIDFAFDATFFTKLKENMPDNASVFVAEKQGKVIGVKAVLWQGGYANSCFIGVDHDTAGNDFTYFNLAYYTSIKKAIEQNVKTVDYGNGLYSVKTDRGCYISRTYIYYKPASIIQKLLAPLLFNIHSRWYERKITDQMRLHLR